MKFIIFSKCLATIIGISVLLIIGFCDAQETAQDSIKAWEKLRSQYQSSPSSLDKNDWDIESFVDTPDCQNLKIIYTEKYGMTISRTGKALFYNSKTREYKLVSPEGDVKIEKDNIYTIEKFKMPIEDTINDSFNQADIR